MRRILRHGTFLESLTLGSVSYAAGWWVPRLWQQFAGPSDRSQAVTSLVVLAVSAVGLVVGYLVFRRVTRVEIATPDSFQPIVSRLFQPSWRGLSRTRVMSGGPRFS